MGRSVMTLSDATAVAYTRHEPDEDYYREGYREYVEEGWLDPEADDFEDWMWDRWNTWDSESEWQNYLLTLREDVMRRFPSFNEADEWIDQEIHVIAQNEHSIVAVAEFGGTVAVMLAPRYDRDTYWRDPEPTGGLGETWRKQISEKFLTLFGDMRKIGTASNGEAFFERSN